MEFRDFKLVVDQQFKLMSEHQLLVVDVEKDLLWDTYLSSFPQGSNPIFKERTEHDCQCCKSFIRAVGGVVAIINNEIVSIWDLSIDSDYQPVADALAALVKSRPVQNIFLHHERTAGIDQNYQETESGEVLTWNHFHADIPNQFVNRDPGGELSDARATFDVMLRGLNEITTDAVETILELIDQNSLYRGEEHRAAVEGFRLMKDAFDCDACSDEIFCWQRIKCNSSAVTRIRNTAIGTLLTDLSTDVELDKAVKSFESKVAPSNYKRPTALVTQGMIKKAEQTVDKLGFLSALERRYSVVEDLTINNVLFADRSARQKMNVFDEMAAETPVKSQSFDTVEEVEIEKFLADILPKAKKLEVMFENKHSGNLVSLISPVDRAAKNMFKWPNNFSWAYAGEVADSMRERVKAAGGDVTGDLRFSIQWNDEDTHNQSDYDAHCIEPSRNLIYYGNKGHRHVSSGMLDVDITGPNKLVPAVENITYADRRQMPEGEYDLVVHNYAKRSGDSGFRAEIEFDGVIHSFNYPKALRQDEKIRVATVGFRDGEFKVIKSLPSEQSAKQIWSINTQQFHQVKTVMMSPNHWDGHKVGNRHVFFMLQNCNQDGKARGFFNEFLTEDLRDHRKVFEILGSKLKAPESDDQLSGLGFSSTQNNSVLIKVEGTFSRVIRVNF